jgi:hypothetical protein
VKAKKNIARKLSSDLHSININAWKKLTFWCDNLSPHVKLSPTKPKRFFSRRRRRRRDKVVEQFKFDNRAL